MTHPCLAYDSPAILGCSILYDGGLPFADDGLLFLVVNGSCVVAVLVNITAAWRAVLIAAPHP